MQFVAGSVRNLKIMVMKGLKNYAELYLMNSCLSPPQESYSYQVCNSMYECDASIVKLCDSDF